MAEPSYTACSTKRRTSAKRKSSTDPIEAELIGSDQCQTNGITVRSSSPILAMCRKLIEAGHDPDRPLHVYRSNILALKVRSIGEGAKLRVSPHGFGFISGVGGNEL
jgi:hypothetical protein